MEEEDDNSVFLNNRQPYLPVPSCPGCPNWLRSNVIIMGQATSGVFLKSLIVLIFRKLPISQITQSRELISSFACGELSLCYIPAMFVWTGCAYAGGNSQQFPLNKTRRSLLAPPKNDPIPGNRTPGASITRIPAAHVPRPTLFQFTTQ